VRSLGLGSDEKSDIKSDLFAVDCKCCGRWSIPKWWKELKTYADRKGKIPILAVKRPREKQYLAVIDLDNLISILKASGHIVTDTDQVGGTGEKTESES
jgi:hypothetical protein